jgi:hypothetical protein
MKRGCLIERKRSTSVEPRPSRSSPKSWSRDDASAAPRPRIRLTKAVATPLREEGPNCVCRGRGQWHKILGILCYTASEWYHGLCEAIGDILDHTLTGGHPPHVICLSFTAQDAREIRAVEERVSP